MTRVAGRFSHRGRGLMLIGAVWSVVGLVILSDSGHPDAAWPLGVLPAWAQGAMWLVAGTVGVVAPLAGAAAERTKWAFAMLLVPAAAVCLSNLVSWAASLAGLPLHGGTWLEAVLWGLVVAFVLHEASTPVMPSSLMGER